MRRSGRSAAVTALVSTMLAVPAAASAQGPSHKPAPHKAPGHMPHKAPETAEHALVHWINLQRQKHGLPPLAPASQLTRVAHLHTDAMVDQGRVWHDPRLGHEVTGWVRLGEDVGRASSLASIEYALLSTPANRVNVLGPQFRDIGVGTGGRNGSLYVTVLVRQPTPPKHH